MKLDSSVRAEEQRSCVSKPHVFNRYQLKNTLRDILAPLGFLRANGLLLLLILLLISLLPLSAHNAICTVPVTNLIGQPMHTFELGTDIQTLYEQLPLSWGPCEKDRACCPRIHQLLFHERVTVLQETDQEALIRVPQCYYLKDNNRENLFWVQKEKLLNLDDYPDLEHYLPAPISFEKNNIAQVNHNVATLKTPFHCNSLSLHFSVGTRFVIDHEEEKNFIVYVLNPAYCICQLIAIPKEYVIKNDVLDHALQRKLFVDCVREWACQNTIIPYVWGGCSYIDRIEDQDFQEHALQSLAGKILAYWHRTNTKTFPLTGFDCSNLILRAAQLVSLPLYAKNSTSMAHSFCTVAHDEPLEDGDIIWFKGHVVIIGSVENNMLIEARGYGSGFGKLHELPLEKLFFEIKTFDQLRQKLSAGQPVGLLNKAGIVTREITEIKLLKLLTCNGSIFPTHIFNQKKDFYEETYTTNSQRIDSPCSATSGC